MNIRKHGKKTNIAAAPLPTVEALKAAAVKAGEALLLRILEAGPAPMLITHDDCTWEITIKRTGIQGTKQDKKAKRPRPAATKKT